MRPAERTPGLREVDRLVLAEHALPTDAGVVVVGPGCRDRARAASLVEQVVPVLSDRAVLCLDAAALPAIGARPALVAEHEGCAILLPNVGEVGEAAELLCVERAVVDDDPARALGRAVTRFGAPIAIRGTTTWISSPGSELFVERAGHPALGTSGSGDVLVGVVAALAARGADPLGAVLWGVHVHARCGEVLAARHGGLGLLARDLLEQVPPTLNELTRDRPGARSTIRPQRRT